MRVRVVRTCGGASACSDADPVQPRRDVAARPHAAPGMLGLSLHLIVHASGIIRPDGHMLPSPVIDSSPASQELQEPSPARPRGFLCKQADTVRLRRTGARSLQGFLALRRAVWVYAPPCGACIDRCSHRLNSNKPSPRARRGFFLCCGVMGSDDGHPGAQATGDGLRGRRAKPAPPRLAGRLAVRLLALEACRFFG